MIARHPQLATFAVIMLTTCGLFTVGLVSGWSDGALGWSLIGACLIGALFRGFVDHLRWR